eukprot:UC4_evm1s225
MGLELLELSALLEAFEAALRNFRSLTSRPKSSAFRDDLTISITNQPGNLTNEVQDQNTQYLDSLVLRMRIKALAQHIILKGPKFAEEHRILRTLWKTVFHPRIEEYRGKAKSLKKEPNFRLETSARNFLSESIGFYHSMVSKLVARSQENQNVLSYTAGKKGSNFFTPLPGSTPSAVTHLVHNLLVSLGDLSRYQMTLVPSRTLDSQRQALRYYFLAYIQKPSDGTSLNQLAVLSAISNRHGGTESVYFYVRSSLCEFPCKTARNNLKKLFHTLRSARETIRAQPLPTIGINDSAAIIKYAELMRRRCFANFCHVYDHLWNSKDLESFESVCEDSCTTLDNCLIAISLINDGDNILDAESNALMTILSKDDISSMLPEDLVLLGISFLSHPLRDRSQSDFSGSTLACINSDRKRMISLIKLGIKLSKLRESKSQFIFKRSKGIFVCGGNVGDENPENKASWCRIKSLISRQDSSSKNNINDAKLRMMKAMAERLSEQGVKGIVVCGDLGSLLSGKLSVILDKHICIVPTAVVLQLRSRISSSKYSGKSKDENTIKEKKITGDKELNEQKQSPIKILNLMAKHPRLREQNSSEFLDLSVGSSKDSPLNPEHAEILGCLHFFVEKEKEKSNLVTLLTCDSNLAKLAR